MCPCLTPFPRDLPRQEEEAGGAARRPGRALQGGEWMPGQAGGLAGTSQGAPRPAFRPSPGAGTPPRRNCVPGNRVPPRLRKPSAVSHLRPGRRWVRNGFPSLLGDRAARRRDVRARWRHGPREAPGASGKLALGSGQMAPLTLSACEAGRRGGGWGRRGPWVAGRGTVGSRERAQLCLLGWEPRCVCLSPWSWGPRGGLGSSCS